MVGLAASSALSPFCVAHWHASSGDPPKLRRSVSIIVILAVAGLAYLSTGWSARPRVLCLVNGRPLSPLAGEGRWVAWLEGDGKERRLVLAPRSGRRPRTVLTGAGLSGLAVSGESAYVTRAEAGGGAELLEISLPGGGTKTIAELSEGADQLTCSGGWLVWQKSRPAGVLGVPFVAAAAPVTVVRARPVAEGPVRVVAVVSGEGGASNDGFELLGAAGDRAYWIERSPASQRTWVRRAPCAGGATETIAEEQGLRRAALGGEVLVWTGPSLEAGRAQSFASVKRMNVGKGGADAIADWLGTGTAVMISDGQAYAQERGSLWRLGERRGEQRRLSVGPPGLMSARVIGDEEVMFLEGAGGSAVAKRPLTAWARLRAMVGG